MGPTTHNEIYDLVVGPKPADVAAEPLPTEEQFPPANWRFSAYTERDGKLLLHRIACGTNGDSVHRGLFEVYYTDEATNRYRTVVGTLDPNATEFTYSGTPPVEGEWLLAWIPTRSSWPNKRGLLSEDQPQAFAVEPGDP